MDKAETLEEFYKRKFDWMPDTIRNELGHFNLFRLEPYVEGKPTSIPYKRRDFYKIMLVKGRGQEPEKGSVISQSPATFISKIIESPEKYSRENVGVNKPNS